MLYRYKNNGLEPLKYFDYSELAGNEKDLENLLAENLGSLYAEDALLMPIFQERKYQEEPDLCALDRYGNLVIFELKRGHVWDNTTIQVMRYAQIYGQKGYVELNSMYKKYIGDNEAELSEAHASAFELTEPLSAEAFNRKQKLIIVGSSSDVNLIRAVEYWKAQNIDIDFMPYRFYKIGESGEIYFEFFAKPYDYHVNLQDRKGVMFDTNLTYSDDNEAQMLKRGHIEAYGDKEYAADIFSKGDYALFYSKGRGIIAIGRIISDKARQLTGADDAEYGGRYHEVDMIVPKNIPESSDDYKSILPYEIKELLGQGFYFARIDKRPYLNEEQVKILINELAKRYNG